MSPHRTALIVAACSLAWTAGVLAADKPPEDYAAAMKTLAGFLQTMAKEGMSSDFEATKPYVPIVRDAFSVVERYWTARNTDRQYFPEIQVAQDGIKIASDMGVAANLQSAEGVAASVKQISALCQPCHDTHREKGPDGSFLIK